MLKKIINYIKVHRNIDLNGYDDEFVREQIEHRILEIKAQSYGDYLIKFENDPIELEKLTERLSNNTSMFFRKPFLYEYLQSIVLPKIISEKRSNNDLSLRIWSAGCSQGQEPYTMSILIHELLHDSIDFNVNIFASDVNEENLVKAGKAVYSMESVKNVKYGWLKKYFTPSGNQFELIPTAKEWVQFSKFDLLDLKHYAPPESIFGNFDIVFCCNVLIYYKSGYKEIIFTKLLKDLALGGLLVLGDSEEPPARYRTYFKRLLSHENIYIKIG